MRLSLRVCHIGCSVSSLSLLCLPFAWAVLAESLPAGPTQPPAEKAPWQRMLGGADAKRAAELEKQRDALAKADRYADAQEVAQQLVELRARVQGAEHWQTDDARRTLADLRRLGRLSAEERAQIREVDKQNERMEQLWQAHKYQEALPLAEKAVAIRRRLLGAEHPDYASSLHDLAVQHQGLGAYRAAQPHLEDVLAIRRKVLGEAHPSTAESYRDLGLVLFEQGKYAMAEPLARTSLAIRRKVLGEEHPDTVASNHEVAVVLDALGKYAEAEPLHRTALVMTQKVRGEMHSDTALSYNGLAFNLDRQAKLAEAEALYRTALAIRRKVSGEEHPDTALSYNNLAVNLNYQGKYAEAEPLCRAALAIWRKVLGEAHPETAVGYVNVADTLDGQGKYAEAELLYRTALAILRKVLGETHPHTAGSYDHLAANLTGQGKYAEAELLSRQALAIKRKVLGETHPDTAASYDHLAFNLNRQGKYAEAIPLSLRALAIRREVLGEAHPATAASYSSVAAAWGYQGKDAEAEPKHRTALAIYRKALGEAHPTTAAGCASLADCLNAQGKYAEAEPLYRTALAIRRRVFGEAHPLTADSEHAVARNLHQQGKYSEANPLFRNALATRRKVLGEAHPDTVLSYTDYAINLNALGRVAEAEALWRAAAQSFEAARLDISFAGLERAPFDTRKTPLHLLAACLARSGKEAEAWKYWEASLARGLGDELSARFARRLSDEERRRENALFGQVQLVDKQIAILVRAKVATDEHRQQMEKLYKQRTAALVELSRFEAELSRVHGPAAGQVYDLEAIQKRIPTDAALVGWLDIRGEPKAAAVNGEHWAYVVRRHGTPVWVKLPGGGEAWTELDDQLPAKVGGILIEQPRDSTAKWRALTGQLYKQRLSPLAKHLGATEDLPAVRHLIVLPSPAIAGIPVEALIEARTDEQPAYTVSYAHSGTMFAWLQEQRPIAAARKRTPRLLALGDPVFAQPHPAVAPAVPPPTHGVLVLEVGPGLNADRAGIRPQDVLLSYAGIKLTRRADLLSLMAKQSEQKPIAVQVWRAGKTLDLTVRPGPLGVRNSNQPVAEALAAEREFSDLLQRTRGQPFSRLPSTRREVEVIAGLFDKDQADQLLGSQASEQRLEELAASWRLKDYAYLHLATHGVLHPRIAMHSALILSQDNLPDPLQQVLAGKKAYDGRLTAEQILRTWKLDADLVTLSACQTGLGQYQGGEGYLGFAQALFLAGGRSLVLSLWKVDDNATALLMTRFYQNLLGKRPGLAKPMPKAEALQEAKAWLRSLTGKEVEQQLAALPRGEEREKPAAPVPAAVHPYGHPYYWAAFILIGDPQ
jgi:CHAT domain-containing protein